MNKLVCSYTALPKDLAKGMFYDRRRQFVDRHKWDLCLDENGCEVDEYDDDSSYYLIAHQNRRHTASCRVRPTGSPTMLVDHFLPHFPEAERFLRMQNGRVFELTRFCRTPDIPAASSVLVLRQLSALIDEFKVTHGLTGFIAVVYPNVARFMDRIGMRYLVLAKSKIDHKSVELVCITQASRELIDIGNGSRLTLKSPEFLGLRPRNLTGGHAPREAAVSTPTHLLQVNEA